MIRVFVEDQGITEHLKTVFKTLSCHNYCILMSGLVNSINNFVSSCSKSLKGPQVAAISAFVFCVDFSFLVLLFVFSPLWLISLLIIHPNLQLDVLGLMFE